MKQAYIKTALWSSSYEPTEDDYHQMDDGAYEILANFGEMQRTCNGYKSIDPRTCIDRIKRTLTKVEDFITRATT